MKKNEENNTMTAVNDYHADLQNLVQEANVLFDNITDYLYTTIKEIAKKHGRDIKDVVADYNNSGVPFPISYNAVKQHTYNKKKKTVATTKKTAYKILFDTIVSKRGELTEKQRQSCIKALQAE